MVGHRAWLARNDLATHCLYLYVRTDFIPYTIRQCLLCLSSRPCSRGIPELKPLILQVTFFQANKSFKGRLIPIRMKRLMMMLTRPPPRRQNYRQMVCKCV